MRGGWLLAIFGIQLRLIANMLDGMVAVEGRPSFQHWTALHEVHDRLSDIILLISAGYAFSSRPEKLAGQLQFLPCWSLTSAR